MSRWPELRKFDCFVFALLSHGNGSEMGLSVEFTDHEFVDVEEILTQFNNLHCRKLVGKPKVFLFPFCRYVWPWNCMPWFSIPIFGFNANMVLPTVAEADYRTMESARKATVHETTLNVTPSEQIYPLFTIWKYATQLFPDITHSVIRRLAPGISRQCAEYFRTMPTTRTSKTCWSWLAIGCWSCEPSTANSKHPATRIVDSIKLSFSIPVFTLHKNQMTAYILQSHKHTRKNNCLI